MKGYYKKKINTLKIRMLDNWNDTDDFIFIFWDSKNNLLPQMWATNILLFTNLLFYSGFKILCHKDGAGFVFCYAVKLGYQLIFLNIFKSNIFRIRERKEILSYMQRKGKWEEVHIKLKGIFLTRISSKSSETVMRHFYTN